MLFLFSCQDYTLDIPIPVPDSTQNSFPSPVRGPIGSLDTCPGTTYDQLEQIDYNHNIVYLCPGEFILDIVVDYPLTLVGDNTTLVNSSITMDSGVLSLLNLNIEETTWPWSLNNSSLIGHKVNWQYNTSTLFINNGKYTCTDCKWLHNEASPVVMLMNSSGLISGEARYNVADYNWGTFNLQGESSLLVNKVYWSNGIPSWNPQDRNLEWDVSIGDPREQLGYRFNSYENNNTFLCTTVNTGYYKGLCYYGE